MLPYNPLIWATSQLHHWIEHLLDPKWDQSMAKHALQRLHISRIHYHELANIANPVILPLGCTPCSFLPQFSSWLVERVHWYPHWQYIVLGTKIQSHCEISAKPTKHSRHRNSARETLHSSGSQVGSSMFHRADPPCLRLSITLRVRR